MCKINNFEKMGLDRIHPFYNVTLRQIVESELGLYHRCYLPVRGTVLDVGAGCGEVALFYLNHGAEKVVCVEANPQCCSIIREVFRDDPRIVLVEARIDSLMVDIEGSEEGMRLETHFPARFRRIWKPSFAPNVTLYQIERTRFPMSRMFGEPLKKNMA